MGPNSYPLPTHSLLPSSLPREPPALSLPHACASRRMAAQIRRLPPFLTHAHGGGRRHRSVGSLPPSRMCAVANGDTDPPDLFLRHACAWRRTVTQIRRLSPSSLTHVHDGEWRHRSTESLPLSHMCTEADGDTDLPALSLQHACARDRSNLLALSIMHAHSGGRRHRSASSLPHSRMCGGERQNRSAISLPPSCMRTAVQ
jgi:hypothetical protein